MAVDWTWIVEDFAPRLMNRIWELLTAPSQNPEMLWMVMPLLIVTIIITLYFGRHPEEELGWNTAFGNSLVLIFVGIDLARYIFHFTMPGSIYNYIAHLEESILVGVIFVEGILLLYANYLHFLPKRMAFFISSALPVNLTAYTVMCVVYTGVAMEWMTLFAAIVLFVVLFALLRTVQGLQVLMNKHIEKVEDDEKKERIIKKVEKEVEKVEEEVEEEVKGKEETEEEKEEEIKEKVIEKLEGKKKKSKKKKK